MYLDRDVTVRVMGVVYHYVVICQRAVEVRGRGDHHLVTIETDVAVTAGDAGGEDPPVTSGEGIGVVVENRDAAGVPGVDLRLVEAGGYQGPVRAAHGDLHGRGDGIVGPVADRDGHVDDGALGGAGAGLRRHGGALQGDVDLGILGELAEGEGQLVPFGVLGRGRQVHAALGTTLLDLEHGALQRGRQVLLLRCDPDRDRERRGRGGLVPDLPVGHLDGDRVLTGAAFRGAVQQRGGVLHDLGAVGVG